MQFFIKNITVGGGLMEQNQLCMAGQKVYGRSKKKISQKIFVKKPKKNLEGRNFRIA